MRRWAWIGSVFLIAAAGIAVAVWWGPASTSREAAKAITAYDLALSRALRQLDPGQLASVAGPAETQRVASHVTLLWGQGKALDATLRNVDVTGSRRTGASTITAEVTESWTYQDIDKDSGRSLGTVRQQTLYLEYTLIRSGDVWIVERARVVEPGSEGGR